MRLLHIKIKCSLFAVLIFVSSTAWGQVIPLEAEQKTNLLKDSFELDRAYNDTLQNIKKRFESRIKKYGKENQKKVLIEMIYEELKQMIDKQKPNPIDVLYDKMIQDLSEEAQGKENHAVSYYSKAFADSLMEKLYFHCNLRERELKYKAIAANLISAAFCKGFNTNNPTYKITAYNNVLLFRNYDILYWKALREHYKDDPILQKFYKDYCNCLDSLNYSSNQDTYTRSSWEIYVERFGSSLYVEENPVPSFSDIKKCIPHNSTLIEYCDTYISGKTHMCAYIIRKTSEAPDIVVLNVSDSLKLSIINTIEAKSINKLYKENQLYHALIEPLLPYVEGSNLYIAPSSYASFVNFSAIKNGDTPITSKYRIVRLFSGADLVDTDTSSPFKDAALFGNIKYCMSSNDLAQETSRFMTTRTSDRGNLHSLPNSLTEINQINRILKSSKVKTKCYYSKYASEAQFKSFDGNSPELIHLATHGYYLNTKDRLAHTYLKENDYNSNTMLFNGLLLSGATLAWNNSIPPPGVEDGILTSEEISRLDLSKTKLIVMSACCTALGDFNEVEGVFGLQRAFKLAGVKNQISTLWPVQDDVACGFMKTFYSNYGKTKSIYTAYNLTLEEIQNIYSEPYYWAGFILLGK